MDVGNTKREEDNDNDGRTVKLQLVRRAVRKSPARQSTAGDARRQTKRKTVDNAVYDASRLPDPTDPAGAEYATRADHTPAGGSATRCPVWHSGRLWKERLVSGLGQRRDSLANAHLICCVSVAHV